MVPIALRLLEVLVPSAEKDNFEATMKRFEVLSSWNTKVDDKRFLYRIVTEQTQPILDSLQRVFQTVDGFRVVVMAVEATVPSLEKTNDEAGVRRTDKKSRTFRVSREEIHAAAVEGATPSVLYIVLAILAALVASAGFIEDNSALIIGAMVLAPLLGSNIALSLGTTLGDASLARKALLTLALGVVIAVGVGMMIGYAVGVDTSGHQISLRTRVGLGDVVVALSAGVAGTLAFTTRLSGLLIGVMVAVALFPPLVATGMLMGSGHWNLALDSLYLVLITLIGINLAGTGTFLAQGVRPLGWWEKEKARKTTVYALALWTVLLVVLIIVILLSNPS